jgi:hypothetical protein
MTGQRRTCTDRIGGTLRQERERPAGKAARDIARMTWNARKCLKSLGNSGLGYLFHAGTIPFQWALASRGFAKALHFSTYHFKETEQ